MRRHLAALLASSALVLGACQTTTESVTEPTTSGQSPRQPGDLLPGTGPGEVPTVTVSDGRPPSAPTGAEPSTSEADGPEPTTEATPTEATPTEGERPSLGAPGIPECDVLEMPAAALPVIEDIEAGGPYDYPRNDGVRFQNREGILPDEDRDYYREFTVETPGLDHRGARRIVTGGFEETDPDHWYFTDDHYESFCEFDPELMQDW